MGNINTIIVKFSALEVESKFQKGTVKRYYSKISDNSRKKLPCMYNKYM